jgi:aubergine-like protein
MSDNFRNNFVEGLKFYKNKNKTLPDRIVVYRDGVSEGEIQHVYEVEIKQIQEALDSVAGKGAIRLAFIIVTKRVSSRFFLQIGKTNACNPFPGTVIDHTVTRQGKFDFYLISQSVKQGTVGPTNYNVLEDSTNWKPHHHQQFAFKMTHLYFNWMGTIRVPAPCQYAHKLAYLTGTALHREPNVALADTLFYL